MKIPITFMQSQRIINTAEDYNRHLRAHRRKRQLAIVGTALFAINVGCALGALAANRTSWFAVAVVTAWGVWGLNHLITRHK